MRNAITILLLLFLTTTAVALGPPAIEWEKTFGTEFYDIWETQEGNIIVGAHDSLFLTDSDGDIIWSTTSTEIGWHYFKFQVVLPLSSGGFLATGVGKVEENSSFSIPIARFTEEGNLIWLKSYGYTEFTEYAYDAVELPDGGYAFAARKGGTAWILRTDSEGDTLWTREWAYTSWATAVSILYHDNGLLVFAQGNTPSTSGGPHLLRYDLDGNLLWANNFPDWPGTVTPGAQAMCEASDGGLLLMDNYWPVIMHTDYEGNTDWWFGVQGGNQPYGYSLDTTMDGGIIFGGEQMGGPPKSICGIIGRYDSTGNQLWHDWVYNSDCAVIYSVRQLSHGGYIAAGKTDTQGILIKYAPETGIEESEASSLIEIDLSPNPFSSALSVGFDLPEAMEVSVSVFDLNGRVVDEVASDFFPAGGSVLEWNAPEELGSGCYLIRLESASEFVTRNCILLR